MRSVRRTGRLAAALALRTTAEAVAAGEVLPDVARGEAVLTALQSLSTCAAAVQRWDPVRSRHETLASSGYVGEALAAMEGAFHQDPLFPAVRASGRPLRVCDIAPADRRGPMFERVITPLRFTDGVSLCLVAGGRYVGSLHASTASDGVDDEAVDWLRLLRADLAGLVDPLGGQLPVVPGDGGVLAWLPDDGRVLALTPSGRASLLSGPLAALLHPSSWPSRLGRHLLVLRGAELTGVEARPAGRWVVVEHRPVAAPANLSLRELEVLCGLALGGTNRMVARSLGVTERTVATHVEHVLTKLGAGNRAAAAAFAVGAGLVRLPA
ncbi:LuxR C-terminal-related transcriptional regulator [Geodermatophilus sp. DSM 45219]|uniref:helix-turn-helix transcriptional regulator n=1 Tax=Geodermatophilus sp. DSM 45219 TaxID=1881103 RepID=UPI000886A0CF|nr:LuxR C-terminal-related transcriptional regulator [Geodermatophilus sp. DSM 45219]SDO46089.1 regulatory protein, luxR family [Geodermatophilus sp. DSM 45219]